MSVIEKQVRGTGRLVIIDLMRGVAIALMVIFHFCFDLAHFGFARFDFYGDAFWLNFRTFILSLFLLLVGISLVLATRKGINVRRFMERLLRVAGGAALVSFATWWMFAERFVFFGVLHFIALASLLGLFFIRKPVIALVLGIALLVVGNSWQFPWFDQAGWRWIGMMTHKPATEDYVPLVPWFGVILIGMVVGYLLSRGGRLKAFDSLLPADNAPVRLLAFSGRHSLLIYLVHQPLLFSMINLYVLVAGS